MRGNERLSRWGAEVLAEAQAVYVGSEHIRAVLEDVVGHVDRVHEVPPGVDVDEFAPASRDVALAALIDESRRDQVDARRAPSRSGQRGALRASSSPTRRRPSSTSAS